MYKNIFIIVLLLVFSLPARAQLENALKKAKAISYRADRCRYTAAKQKADCHGNVVVTRSDMRISCDSFQARFDNRGRIIHVLCSGHVNIVTKKRIAKSEQASYSAGDESLLLEGSARVAQGQSRLAGDSILLNLKSGNIEVLGKVRGLLGKDLMKSKKP